MVITGGATRVAEVSARFTLDSMPGKQLSIDADLNSGLINEDQAKARRRKLEREADFYGTMDGASKFVKGDATAGIIISNADNGMHINEYEFILNELSCFHIFPKDYLETIAKQDVGKLFEESVTKIMQTNPDARDSMLQYMIALVMADKEIKASEVDLILKIAQNLLGYLPIETAQIFSQMIRGSYSPNLNSLC